MLTRTQINTSVFGGGKACNLTNTFPPMVPIGGVWTGHLFLVGPHGRPLAFQTFSIVRFGESMRKNQFIPPSCQNDWLSLWLERKTVIGSHKTTAFPYKRKCANQKQRIFRLKAIFSKMQLICTKQRSAPFSSLLSFSFSPVSTIFACHRTFLLAFPCPTLLPILDGYKRTDLK